MKRRFSTQIPSSKQIPDLVNNFISVKSDCGLNLKTTHFPALNNKPHTTIFFIHSYGSYLTKYQPVMWLYQSAGYEVVGFDMRGFGESDGTPRALITNPEDMVQDSKNFLTKAR